MKKHEIKQCSIKEFNTIVSKLKNRKFINDTAHLKDVGPKVYLWSLTAKAYLVYNEYTPEHITTKCFETDLNDSYDDGWLKTMDSTQTHCMAVGKALKFPRLVKDKSEALVHASGIIWSNSNYNNTSTYCYEYDLHLAWLSTFMTYPLPDTTVPARTKDFVRKNEIGFLINGLASYGCGDAVVFDGYADYIFPIIYNPNPKYTEKLLKKINSSTGLERKNNKNRFNQWLGSMQNKNPFIRVAVIAQSNAKIINLIKKYKNKLIFSVTDSLGSIERIPELDNLIGEKPGDWSIKNIGYLYSDRFNRLYLDENGFITNAVVRGVPKQHLKDLNIIEYKNLIKKIDASKNLYKIDFKNRKVILNNEKEKVNEEINRK